MSQHLKVIAEVLELNMLETELKTSSKHEESNDKKGGNKLEISKEQCSRGIAQKCSLNPSVM